MKINKKKITAFIKKIKDLRNSFLIIQFFQRYMNIKRTVTK